LPLEHLGARLERDPLPLGTMIVLSITGIGAFTTLQYWVARAHHGAEHAAYCSRLDR